MSKRTELGKLLVIERAKNDLTGAELAKLLGVAPAYYSCAERGIKRFSKTRAEQLIKILNIEDEKNFWRLFYQQEKTIPIENLNPEVKAMVIDLVIENDDLSTYNPKVLRDLMEDYRELSGIVYGG